jgi:alpha-L-fucosidase
MIRTVSMVIAAACSGASAAGPPLPTAKQLEWMDLETIQFMHFSIPTSWNPPDDFLRRPNPTYHNCIASWIPDHGEQTEGYYPCLNPKIFQPNELDVEQWMKSAASLNMKEICLTAKHAGGFTMWPSEFTPYGVQSAMNWRGGKGDVLREFVDAAKRWGIKICYYINPMTDGYLANVANVSAAEFQRRQKGMMTEVLTKYGPVNRLWFDGVNTGVVQKDMQTEAVYKPYYDSVFKMIREISPDTLISAYRGDVCTSIGSLYTNDGPAPNASDSAECQPASETGKYFHPTEMHGVTMQEGPDGNTPIQPTYWFWHAWACAGNVSGCPWVGHANASRIFNSYVATVGHGGVMNMNIAPDATGRLNASVVQVMEEAGKAINDTFHLNHAGSVEGVSGACTDGAPH